MERATGLGSSRPSPSRFIFGAGGASAASGAPANAPTTPVLDDFNRPNENPVSQGGNWSPNALTGAPASVRELERSLRAGRTDEARAEQLGSARLTRPTTSGPRRRSHGAVELHERRHYLYIGLQDAGTRGLGRLRAGPRRVGEWLSSAPLPLHERGPHAASDSPLLQQGAGDRSCFCAGGDDDRGVVPPGGRVDAAAERAQPDAVRRSGKDRRRLLQRRSAGAIDDFGGGAIGAPPPPPPPPPPSATDPAARQLARDLRRHAACTRSRRAGASRIP